MEQFLEEINQNGFEIYIQFHRVVLAALINFLISIQGCFVELNSILVFEKGRGRLNSSIMISCPGGHAGGLHLFLTLGGDEVVVFGVAEAERLLEVNEVGVFSEEKVPVSGMVTLTVKVGILLEIFIRLVLALHYFLQL